MGLESRSGQGFSRPAVATAITASGIVTHKNIEFIFFAYIDVATAITASGIVTSIQKISLLIFSCNSDYCKRYCDPVSQRSGSIEPMGCNGDNCERYCDGRFCLNAALISRVATVITASGIVTYTCHAPFGPRLL